MGICIAKRKVVHTHIVTSLHINVVVLGEGRVINFLGPIGLIVIHVVIEIGRIVVQEVVFHFIVVDVWICSQKFRRIEAILRCIHHLWQTRLERYAHTDVGIDAGGHTASALGGDDDDTVATLGTIECGSVLQNLHVVDVFRVNVEKQVVVIAIMESHTGLLHVAHDAIDNDERLCISIQRIQTTDEHGGAISWTTRTVDGTHVGSKDVLNFGINSLRSGVVDFSHWSGRHIGAILVHNAELVGNHDDMKVTSLSNAHLLAKILCSVDKERCGKGWHTDGKLALCISHGGETVVVERLHLHTSEWCLSGGIDDNTLHFLHGILRLFLDRSGLLDNSFLLGAFCIDHLVIILGKGSIGNGQCEKNADR